MARQQWFPQPIRTGAKRQSQVVMNRRGLTEAQLGMADALAAIGAQTITDASRRAPRDSERAAQRGVPMMADTGHWTVYANGKRVGADDVWGSTGKPRSMRTPQGEVVLGMWFSSRLAHLIEWGTVKQIARPFFAPALNANIRDTEAYTKAAMARRLATSNERAVVSALTELRRSGVNVKPAMRKAQAARARAERRVKA